MAGPVSSKNHSLFLISEIQRLENDSKALGKPVVIAALALIIISILLISLVHIKLNPINKYGVKELTLAGKILHTVGCSGLVLGGGLLYFKMIQMIQIARLSKQLDQIKRRHEAEQIEMKSLGSVKV